jgi:RNA polymerase sigma-70 factor (ECF subfamily)
MPQHQIKDLSTDALVALARAGAADAFGELVRRNELGLYNFLLRRVGSREDALELAQESFLRAWQKLSTYDTRWSFSTWLYAVGRSVAANHARRSSLPRAEIEVEAHASARAAESEGQDGAWLWALAERTLSREQHSALWLACAEDKSAAEIGAILGRSVLAVRMILFRARSRLATAIEKREEQESRRASERLQQSDSPGNPDRQADRKPESGSKILRPKPAADTISSSSHVSPVRMP